MGSVTLKGAKTNGRIHICTRRSASRRSPILASEPLLAALTFAWNQKRCGYGAYS